MPRTPLNGLMSLPYTEEDWLVLSIAIAGTIFKIILMYEDKDTPNPTIRDYLSIITTSYIVTIGLYELVIIKDWSIQTFYIPFAIAIVSAKDISDWIFMSEDGRKFIKNTFIIMLEKLLRVNKDDK